MGYPAWPSQRPSQTSGPPPSHPPCWLEAWIGVAWGERGQPVQPVQRAEFAALHVGCASCPRWGAKTSGVIATLGLGWKEAHFSRTQGLVPFIPHPVSLHLALFTLHPTLYPEAPSDPLLSVVGLGKQGESCIQPLGDGDIARAPPVLDTPPPVWIVYCYSFYVLEKVSTTKGSFVAHPSASWPHPGPPSGPPAAVPTRPFSCLACLSQGARGVGLPARAAC